MSRDHTSPLGSTGTDDQTMYDEPYDVVDESVEAFATLLTVLLWACALVALVSAFVLAWRFTQ